MAQQTLIAPSSISYQNGILSGSGASANNAIDDYDFGWHYGYEISILPHNEQTWNVYYHTEEKGSFQKPISITNGSQIKVRRYEEYLEWDYNKDKWKSVDFEYSPTYSPTITFLVKIPSFPQLNYNLSTDILNISFDENTKKIEIYKALEGDLNYTLVKTVDVSGSSYNEANLSSLLGADNWQVMVRAKNELGQSSNDSEILNVQILESIETAILEVGDTEFYDVVTTCNTLRKTYVNTTTTSSTVRKSYRDTITHSNTLRRSYKDVITTANTLRRVGKYSLDPIFIDGVLRFKTIPNLIKLGKFKTLGIGGG